MEGSENYEEVASARGASSAARLLEGPGFERVLQQVASDIPEAQGDVVESLLRLVASNASALAGGEPQVQGLVVEPAVFGTRPPFGSDVVQPPGAAATTPTATGGVDEQGDPNMGAAGPSINGSEGDDQKARLGVIAFYFERRKVGAPGGRTHCTCHVCCSCGRRG